MASGYPLLPHAAGTTTTTITTNTNTRAAEWTTRAATIETAPAGLSGTHFPQGYAPYGALSGYAPMPGAESVPLPHQSTPYGSMLYQQVPDGSIPYGPTLYQSTTDQWMPNQWMPYRLIASHSVPNYQAPNNMVPPYPVPSYPVPYGTAQDSSGLNHLGPLHPIPLQRIAEQPVQNPLIAGPPEAPSHVLHPHAPVQVQSSGPPQKQKGAWSAEERQRLR